MEIRESGWIGLIGLRNVFFDLYALYGESWCNALCGGGVESMVRRGADVVLTSVPSVDVERCHVVLLNRVCEVNV